MEHSSQISPRDLTPLPNEQLDEFSVGHLETRFIDRVVDALPLPRGVDIPEADQIAHAFVADAFIEWFSPYRNAFEQHLEGVDSAHRKELKQSYATMLEHVALREAVALPSTEDRWQRGGLLDELETAAAAFYHAILQHQGWIEMYGCIFGDDTPRERYDYLKLVNRARGFLGRLTNGIGEQQHLREIGLYDDQGVILPREPIQRSWDPRVVAENLAEARIQGQEARGKYEDERSAGNEQRMELDAFRSRLMAAQSSYGDVVFSVSGATNVIRNAAQRLVDLEGERRKYYGAADVADESLDHVKRRGLAALLARRADLKASLEKAQTLLRLYKQAESLGVLPSDLKESVRLSDLLLASNP